MASSQLLKSALKTAPQAETVMHKLQDDAYVESWVKSPLYGKLKKHTAATDDTSAIADLSAQVLDYSNPDYIGREVCAIHTTTMESQKVRMPTRGRAVATSSNVTSIQASGASNEFIEIKAEKEFIGKEEWNRQQLEDASSYIVAQQTQAVADALMLLDFLYTLRTDSKIAGRITKTGDAATASADVLIDLWEKVKVKDRQPNAYVMSPTTYATLMKDDDIKNSFQLGGYSRDYSTGDMGTFMGSRFLVSSLVKNDYIACLDTSIVLIYLIRRDSLPLMGHDQANDIHTFRLSTRYGLSKGLTEGMGVWY